MGIRRSALHASSIPRPFEQLYGSRESTGAGVHAPRLSAVIVNYREWQRTAELSRRLLAEPAAGRGEVEVVIVDNHSPPDPVIPRLRRTAGVSLRRWRRNQGFGRAANEGGRLSRGEWLLLLNPDVTLTEGFVDGVLALLDRLAAEPRTGIVGFHLRNGDGTRQLSAGVFPTLLTTLLGLGMPRARRKYRPFQSRRRRRVAWVTGCCLLIRRECLRQLGGFDRDFFLYYEDVDLSRRAARAGWDVWYEPALRAVHHRPLQSRSVPAHLRLFTRHGLLTYAAKHWPRWQLPVLAALVGAEAWIRRQSARWRGDNQAAELFRESQAIARDLARGRGAEARGRLRSVIRRLERLGAVG
jgi:N-acetylglucosaminyl-diphospho-decaprenol L-rhamnosyltransferase